MIANKSIKFSYFVCNKNVNRLKYEWVKPEGYDTGIKIHNPFLKTKVPLIFPHKNSVKWYICGPTVYDVSHIGHASCYIRFDIIRRALEEYFSIKPLIALGVTDVAVNISDRANSLKMPPAELASFYENEFFKQMKSLNVLPPHVKLNVSQHLTTIENFVQVLINKKLAFRRNGDVVFKILTDKNYGRFQSPTARKTSEDLEFALWRKNNPGWHVECSAMASHIFGSSIDIHSGGADLTFPHHENEESLSTCYHDCYQWVNYWVHSGLINIDDEKMSKSLGNLISISDFLDKNTNDHLRMLCFMNPYRSNLTYNGEKISASAKLCERIQQFLNVSELYVQGFWTKGNVQEAVLLKCLEEAKCKIVKCLENDFDTESALKEILMLLKKTTKMLADESPSTGARSNLAVLSVNAFVKNFFKSFGFSFAQLKSESKTAVESVIEATVNFRSSIRSRVLKDKTQNIPLMLCDKVRNDLEKIGIKLTDFSNGSYWVRINEGVDNKRLLNHVIDCLVDFRGALLDFAQKSNSSQNNVLREECRSVKLYLSTLGIVLIDDKDFYKWSFPAPNNSNEAKFNLIMREMLIFYKRIEDIALSINEKNSEESKEELLSIHEAALLNLKSFGIMVDKDGTKWETDYNNTKGESILQNAIDIFIQSFDSVESIISVCEKDRVKYFEDINASSKNSLKSNGFVICKKIPSLLTTWKLVGNIDTKELLLVIIRETVSYIVKLKNSVKCENDVHLKNTIIKIHDSVVADLEKIGVTIAEEPQRYSWKFKTFDIYGKSKREEENEEILNSRLKSFK